MVMSVPLYLLGVMPAKAGIQYSHKAGAYWIARLRGR
jgi:hypothetical protein